MEVAFIPAHFRRKDRRSRPAWVTYHAPSRSCRSPEATENPYSLVRYLRRVKAMSERPPHTERANFTFDLKNADPLEASFRFTFVLLGSNISFVATRPEAMYKGLSERLAWNLC